MVQFEELRLKLLESEKPMSELAAALGLEEMAKEIKGSAKSLKASKCDFVLPSSGLLEPADELEFNC